MKKLFLITYCIFAALFCYSQGSFRYCAYINGIWGTWKDSYSVYMTKVKTQEYVIYHQDDHPSNYIMRFTVYGQMFDNDKKSRKKHIKNGEWYRLGGEVEIFTDAETFINNFPFVANHNTPEIKSVKFPATIGIEPYKKHPVTLNILFDKYGLGIMGNK